RGAKVPGFDINRFWAESFAAGVVARHLADSVFGVDREEAFTAALMSGIGKLALAQGMPDEFSKAVSMANSGRDLLDAERQVIGLDHVSFGVQLLEDWCLPEALVAAVGRQSEECEGQKLASGLPGAVQAAVRLAPLFVRSKELSPQQTQLARD